MIQPGVELAWDPDPDPELPVWAQLQAQLGDLAQLDTTEKENLVWAINELAARECPPGEPGADGVTFKPWITSDGLLKWTNDGGLVNPLPTNIKGPKGEDGVTPVRGVDYWTDADKAEIKAYVEDALLGGAW